MQHRRDALALRVKFTGRKLDARIRLLSGLHIRLQHGGNTLVGYVIRKGVDKKGLSGMKGIDSFQFPAIDDFRHADLRIHVSHVLQSRSQVIAGLSGQQRVVDSCFILIKFEQCRQSGGGLLTDIGHQLALVHQLRVRLYLHVFQQIAFLLVGFHRRTCH